MKTPRIKLSKASPKAIGPGNRYKSWAGMVVPTGMYRQGGRWIARKVIPPELVNIVGKRELKVSRAGLVGGYFV